MMFSPADLLKKNPLAETSANLLFLNAKTPKRNPIYAETPLGTYPKRLIGYFVQASTSELDVNWYLYIMFHLMVFVK